MKRLILPVILLLMADSHVFSQNQPYNVVFDLTSGDTATHQRVIRWMKSILASHPDARLEVVFYGKALSMVENQKSSVAEDVKKLATSKNVTFAVCEQAMKVHDVKKSDLLTGVQTVPDAIYELITKQAEGYGYIKVVN